MSVCVCVCVVHAFYVSLQCPGQLAYTAPSLERPAWPSACLHSAQRPQRPSLRTTSVLQWWHLWCVRVGDICLDHWHLWCMCAGDNCSDHWHL